MNKANKKRWDESRKDKESKTKKLKPCYKSSHKWISVLILMSAYSLLGVGMIVAWVIISVQWLGYYRAVSKDIDIVAFAFFQFFCLIIVVVLPWKIPGICKSLLKLKSKKNDKSKNMKPPVNNRDSASTPPTTSLSPGSEVRPQQQPTPETTPGPQQQTRSGATRTPQPVSDQGENS